jgi:putative membrane protein
MNNKITLALKGAAMGVAEVIPGVSGGTIAFITGIYETLIDSIKAIGPGLLTTFKEDGFAGVWEEVNGAFLVNLAIGMVMGIVVGVFGVTHILETYPVLLWAFFFGLIVASAIYIAKQVNNWGITQIACLIAGIAIAYYITIAAPSEGNTALWFVFLSGMIAISALILPGISGSFILLLMGMYTIIVPTLKEILSMNFDTASLMMIAVFAIGCLTGLMTFSRVLSWTFKNYHNATMAALTGFMIGSLNKIWPWRKAVKGLDEEGNIVMIEPGIEVDKILQEINLSPNSFAEQVGEPFLLFAIGLMIIGFASVFVMERMSK